MTVSQQENKAPQDETQAPKADDNKSPETKAVEKSIKGTWQSTTGGAFLTMDGKEYRLDFMGVDSDAAIIGTYTVDGDLINFINKKDPCKDVKGLYDICLFVVIVNAQDRAGKSGYFAEGNEDGLVNLALRSK